MNYPAICEDTEADSLKRDVGEVLEPSLWPREALKEREIKLGPYLYAALCQQRPGSDSGNVFEREDFRYYDYRDQRILLDGAEIDQNDLYWFIACDPAKTVSERSDWTVVGLFALDTASDPTRLFMIDMIRQQLETPDITPLLLSVYRSHKNISKVYVESVELFQHCQRIGLPVEQLKTSTNKWMRAQPASAWAKTGRLYFPNDVKWLNELQSELLQFPTARHDDIVDVVAHAVRQAEEVRTKFLY